MDAEVNQIAASQQKVLMHQESVRENGTAKLIGQEEI